MVAITGNHDGTTAVDYTVNCAVGYPSATGHGDDPRPVNNVVPAWDLMCGQMAAVGLLAADRRRILEGVGDLVTLALADVALATVSMLGSLAEAQLLGTQREAIGNDLYGAYGSDFPTGDGRRVMVVAISPKQWRGLQAATGTTDSVEALADELGVGFAEGVCWGPYRTFLELVDEDPRCSTANPLFTDLDQPGVGRHLVSGSPLAFAGVEGRGAATAPRLGEHTEQVLADDLGLGEAEIGSLVDRGIVAIAD